MRKRDKTARVWRVVTWTAVGLILLTVGAAVATWLRPHGTRLIGAQLGPGAVLEYRPAPYEALGSLLGLKGMRRAPVPLPAPAPPHILGLWVQFSPPHARKPHFGFLADEHGCEVAVGRGVNMSMTSDPVLRRFDATAFPRRTRELVLRLYQQEADGAWESIGQFAFLNPASAEYPSGKERPLPVAQRAGDLSFTLEGLTPGVIPEGVERHPRELFTRATFRVDKEGRSAQGWRPDSLVITDSTGNRWAPPFTARHYVGGAVYFPHALWPDEASWKLKVGFSRGPDASFSDRERLAISDVTAPTEHVLRERRRTAPLTVIAFAPPGRWADEWRGGQFVPRLSTLVVDVENPKPDQRLSLLSVTDERGVSFGEAAILPLKPRRLGGVPGRHAFGLTLNPGSKKLQLEFALHQSRTVEFVASPERRIK